MHLAIVTHAQSDRDLITVLPIPLLTQLLVILDGANVRVRVCMRERVCEGGREEGESGE